MCQSHCQQQQSVRVCTLNQIQFQSSIGGAVMSGVPTTSFIQQSALTRLNSVLEEPDTTINFLLGQQQHIKTAELISSATNRQGDGGQEN